VAIKVTVNNGSGDVDVTRYVEDASLKVEDSINVPNLCNFTLVNIDNLFVSPIRNAYVKVSSTKENKFLFTGFVTSTPEVEHLGSAPNSKNTSFQRQRYKVQATSDEYLLNIKSVQFTPAFVNQTMGQILANLANVLAPGFFDTSGIQNGDLIPFFQYDPTQKWSDLAKQFADAARFYYQVSNKKIVFEQYSATSLGISYDDTKGQGTFDPYSLKTSVLTVPPVNDAIVIGDVEPQEVHDDYFIGDGVTSNFPLRHAMFRGSSQVLLQEDWTGQALSNNWAETDPQNVISVGSGSLSVLMSASGALGTEYLVGQNGVELGGHLDIQHGEFFFVGVCNGLVGGVHSSTPPTLANCLLGFQLSSVQNFLQWSQEFENSPWVSAVGGTTVGLDVVIAPDGSRTSDVLTATGVNGQRLQVTGQNSAVGDPIPWTLSVWMKVASGTKNAHLFSYRAGGLDSELASFTVTTSWQRFTFTHSLAWTGVGAITVGIEIPTNGDQIHCWGAQLEHANSTGPYVPTTAVISPNVTASFSGASGLQIKPVLNGAELTSAIAAPIVVKTNHHYFLETFVTARRWSRYNQIYRTLAGTPFGDTLLPAQAEITFIVWDIDLRRPDIPVPTKYYTSASLPSFGLYVPVNAVRLNLTLNYTQINQPPQGLLTVQSLYGPTGLQLPIQTPGPAEPYRLGSGFGQQVATIASSQGTGQGATPDALQFYAGSLSAINTWIGGTIPAAGARIRLRSWEAGKALSRVRDPVSIASEAAIVGDDGVRSGVFPDLNPLPRTSEESELAAKATILDRGSTQYDGSYTAYDYFRDKTQDFPRSGRILSVNSPTRGVSGQQFLVRSVNATVESLPDEVIVSTIEFGQDLFVERLLKRFLPNQTNILEPKDAAVPPTPQTLAQLGTTFAADFLDLSVTAIARGQNLLLWSEAFDNAAWQEQASSGPLAVVTPNAAVDPNGNQTADQISYAAIAGGFSDVLQTVALPVKGKPFTFSVWLKTSSGTVPLTLVVQDNAFTGSGQVSLNATVTPTWTQFSVTTTFPVDANDGIYVALRYQTNAAATVFAWGAQLEPYTSVGLYLPTAGLQRTDGQSQIWLDLGSVPVTGAEIRRMDNGWGLSKSGLVATVTTRFVSLQRSQYEQSWYVRQVNGPAVSRFSRVVRVVYPLVPDAPFAVANITDPLRPLISVGLTTDLRNLRFTEIRDSDNLTVLFQQTFASYADLLYTYNNTIAKTRNFNWFVYFANLQNEYSGAFNLQFVIPVPACTLAIDEASMTLVASVSGIQVNRVEWQAFKDVNLTAMTASGSQAVNFAVSGNQVPVHFPLTLDDVFQQRYFVARCTDPLGTGPFNPPFSHIYKPQGLVFFDGVTNVITVPVPPAPNSDPSITVQFQQYTQDMVEESWRMYGRNLPRVYRS
jgi:hypothetical protein